MGLFSNKGKISKIEVNQLNELLSIALQMNSETGTWEELPEDVPSETADKVVSVRKLVFEYIRRLKEAKFYSNGAVQKFVKDEFSWVDKDLVKKMIQLGEFI